MPTAYNKKLSINAIFVAWNKATYLSLNQEKTRAADSSEQQDYENRIENLKYIFVAKGHGIIDSESLRYQFLRKLNEDIGDRKGSFYVIEANQNGAKVLFRDYVVYLNSSHEVSVDVYIFGRDGWFKQAEAKSLTCNIVDGFNRNHVKFGHGFNDDDVIISKFEKNTVKYSDYFLSGTLAASSGIKEVLATYNTKNFIE